MNVASLELCKELYELSGWEGTLCSWKPIDFFGHSGGTYGIREGDFELATGFYEDMETGEEVQMTPAYDLGYLLRKLPNHIKIWTYTLSPKYQFTHVDREVMVEDGSPEDAAAKLAIELFKRGILTKEGK